MSTSESTVVTQVEAKRSWKLPGIYVAACVLLVVFAAAARGDMTLRLNDKSQSYAIPDRKRTRLNSSHDGLSRMPSCA